MSIVGHEGSGIHTANGGCLSRAGSGLHKAKALSYRRYRRAAASAASAAAAAHASVSLQLQQRLFPTNDETATTLFAHQAHLLPTPQPPMPLLLHSPELAAATAAGSPGHPVATCGPQGDYSGYARKGTVLTTITVGTQDKGSVLQCHVQPSGEGGGEGDRGAEERD